MFAHNPDKDQQNWTVQDAIAQSKDKEAPIEEEMKFQVTSNKNYYNVDLGIMFHWTSYD